MAKILELILHEAQLLLQKWFQHFLQFLAYEIVPIGIIGHDGIDITTLFIDSQCGANAQKTSAVANNGLIADFLYAKTIAVGGKRRENWPGT